MKKPDHAGLFKQASEQHGFFTAKQATEHGLSRDVLRHHARTGRFIRIQHGLYRFRDYPSSPYEETMVAWLAAGKETAVVSHESALDLLDLSYVIPNAIHLTVPRARRYQSRPHGVVIHTTTQPLQPSDVLIRHGIRMTSPLRSILDSAETGTAPEQIEMAIQQALRRGILNREQLLSAAAEKTERVRRLVRMALEGEPT